MKKQSKIKNAVERVVDGLVKTLEQMKDFTVEQAPDVAKQMIAERKVELKYDAAINATLMLVMALLGRTCWEFFAETKEELRFFSGLGGTVCLIAAIVSAGCLIETLKNLSMLKAAPKVYLLGKLKELVE